MIHLNKILVKPNLLVPEFFDIVLDTDSGMFRVSYCELEKIKISDEYTKTLLPYENLKSKRGGKPLSIASLKFTNDGEFYLSLDDGSFFQSYYHPNDKGKMDQVLNILMQEDVDDQFIQFYNAIENTISIETFE